jgi:hypothetical protein
VSGGRHDGLLRNKFSGTIFPARAIHSQVRFSGALAASGINRQMPYFVINLFNTASWGHQWVSLLRFCSFEVYFGSQRMNFNQEAVKTNHRGQNTWPLAIFWWFFTLHELMSNIALKQWGPLVGSPVGIRVKFTSFEYWRKNIGPYCTYHIFIQ